MWSKAGKIVSIENGPNIASPPSSKARRRSGTVGVGWGVGMGEARQGNEFPRSGTEAAGHLTRHGAGAAWIVAARCVQRSSAPAPFSRPRPERHMRPGYNRRCTQREKRPGQDGMALPKAQRP
ncbi:hypothetical protein GCM10027564_28070 [Luteimonas notoginsengisoli]